MSDDRWNTDGDHPYLDTKPVRAPESKTAFITADDIEAFLVRYCEKMGIPRHERGKKKMVVR